MIFVRISNEHLPRRANDRYNASVRLLLLMPITTVATVVTVMSEAGVGTARGDDTGTAATGAAPGAEGEGAVVPDAALQGVSPGAVYGEETVSAPRESLGDMQPGAPDAWPDSVSCGAANRGALYGAVLLPRAGAGYVTPEPWWSRGRRYGTAELVGLIMRAAATVEQRHPGGLLGVADLSDENGGVIAGHRSHQSGRDVDLVFYALDPAGSPFPPDQHMAYYGRSGAGQYARAPSFEREIAERYFDLQRNWALVRALLTDAESEVEHIFVSSRVRRWLLDYARQIGEPEDLVMRAARVLRKPKGVDGHNDHLHVRVRCSQDDEARGDCRNENARRPRRARRWRSIVTCPAPVGAPLVSSLVNAR
jgi:penicillin-insensitive murein endopeptidase